MPLLSTALGAATEAIELRYEEEVWLVCQLYFGKRLKQAVGNGLVSIISVNADTRICLELPRALHLK